LLRKELKGFVQSGITAISDVLTGKEGYFDIRWYACSVEGLSILRVVNLVRQVKMPTIRQRSDQNVGEYALCIQTNADGTEFLCRRSPNSLSP